MSKKWNMLPLSASLFLAVSIAPFYLFIYFFKGKMDKKGMNVCHLSATAWFLLMKRLSIRM